MSGPDQRIVLAPTDGSSGPLLRVADDRLAPGAGYGRHEHRDVDVVAVVLAGSLRHRWAGGAELTAGDVTVLRAGAGLTHDEVAGDDGAHVLQCYLRSADPGGPPSHEVHRAATGWIDLHRPDARLWVARPFPAGVEPPPGLPLVAADGDVVVAPEPVREPAAALLVWQLEAGRPSWAAEW